MDWGGTGEEGERRGKLLREGIFESFDDVGEALVAVAVGISLSDFRGD